MAPESYKRRND